MAAKQNLHKNSTLEPLLNRLRQVPEGGMKMLDLAAALSNRGHHDAAAYVEFAALGLGQPGVTHRWRQIQARRAPANQFLLLRNDLRSSAFRKALAERVARGDLVLEIGTGSGILAMMAAQAGAGQVVTCERQPVMAIAAQSIIRDNQLQDKITVLPKRIEDLELGKDLPRRADVLVADLFTGALLEAGGLELVQHAQKKLLHDTAQIIPAAGTLRGKLVGGIELDRLCRIGYSAGFDLSRFNLFSPPVIHLIPERFKTLEYESYSEAIDCFRFDFNRLETAEPINIDVEAECIGSGEISGFLQWLRLELSPDNTMESDESSTLKWIRYLHVFPQPIRVAAGQRLKLHMRHDWASFSVWPS